MSPALCLAAVLAILAAPAACEVTNVALLAANGAEQPERVGPRPRARPEGERRCTADGRLCIRADNYVEDVCRVIEEAAGAEGLDVTFFARLLWRESLFDASAVSHAGAQGIAQFMPGTARLRGLADPFNPAEAILASADYLKELEREFGNLGLSAAAYNAGEERVTRFLAGQSGLPGETRAYVLAITDYSAEAWRAGAPPAPTDPPDAERPFREACVARAEGRRNPPGLEPRLLPWAVAITGRDSREAAEQEALRLVASHGALLARERIDYTFRQFPGMGYPRHFAQIGRESRAEAEALCQRLRDADAGCIVRRN